MTTRKTVIAQFIAVLIWIAAHLVLAFPFLDVLTGKQWLESFVNLGMQLLLVYGCIYAILFFCHNKQAINKLPESELQCIDAFWFIENSFKFKKALLVSIICLGLYTVTSMVLDTYVWGYKYSHITIHIDRRLLMRGLPYAILSYAIGFWLSYTKSRKVVQKLYADKIIQVSHEKELLAQENKLLESSNKNLKELNMTALFDGLFV